MIKQFKNQEGAALVITLAIIAILLATVFQLAKSVEDSANVVQVEKKRFQAEQLALSGINIAIMLLIEDAVKDNIDSVQEIWANHKKLSDIVEALGLGKNELNIKITDELSKIQANALVSEYPGHQFNPDQVKIWENLLRLLLSQDNATNKKTSEEIINSVKDWLDSGDDEAVTGFSGAESDYYQSLNFSYVCPNSPFNHINELSMVKGFPQKPLTMAFYNKTNERNMKNPGDLFTVYGLDNEQVGNSGYHYTGKININTAGIEVLAAILPEGKELLAYDLSVYRIEQTESGGNFTHPLEPGWYKKVIRLSDSEQNRFDRIIRYSTNIFRIESIAQLNETRLILIAYVKREQDKISGKWSCRILQLERE